MSGRRGFQWWSGTLCLFAASALAAEENANDRWNTLHDQMNTLRHQHQLAGALESGKRALAVAQGFDQTDPRRAITYLALGSIYHDWGRCAESRENYLHSLAIWEKQSNPNPAYVFSTVSLLVGNATACGDTNAAEKLFRAHYHELQRFRSGPLDNANVLLLQAGISRGRKRYAQAEDLQRQALRLMEQTPGAEPVDIARVRNNLAVIVGLQGRHEASLAEAQRVIALLESIDARHPSLVAALNTAADALFALGRKEESAQVYQRSLDLARETFGKDNRVTAATMMSYAVVLRAVKRAPEAEAMNREGSDAYRRSSLRNNQTVDVQELGANH